MPGKTMLAIPCIGPYNVSEAAGSRTVEGDALADSDTGTGIVVDAYVSPTNPFLSNVAGVLRRPPAGTTFSRSHSWVYARATASSRIETVIMQVFGKGDSSSTDKNRPPLETSLGTLYPMDSNGFQLVQDAINGYPVTTSASLPSSASHTATLISELWIVVVSDQVEAPPRRLFPREDGLGVGGARRHWPPPRSYQRGARRAGGYL